MKVKFILSSVASDYLVVILSILSGGLLFLFVNHTLIYENFELNAF